MHYLSAWFARNPMAANLLMMLALIAGTFALLDIRIEGFPGLPPSSVTITTAYPGADAEQVDLGISRKIESALEGMPGIKKIASFSSEAFSSIEVQKASGFDMDRFQDEIKSRIDGISNLPQRAERPVVVRDEITTRALLVQIFGDVDEYTLQKVSREIKEELLSHPQITNMTLFGLRPYEIRIEVNIDRLRSYGITLESVAQAIERTSLDYVTGSIESDAGRIIIKADGKAFTYKEFSSIPVLNRSDGSRIMIKDVAKVIDGFETDRSFARFQGKPSVGIVVNTSKKGHLIEVSRAAHEVVERIRPQLPAGIQVDIWAESASYMQARLSLLTHNAWQGLLIVFFLLSVFLNFKFAFWVAMGIPISLAGTIMIMGDWFLGYSLNDVTTFGIIIVLGILVDDAIVVSESIFDVRRREGDSIEGVIRGVRRVSTATVFGCFTTVAAFYPLLLINNDIGKIFASFAVVVIISVLFSMMESTLILPSHLAPIRIEASLSESRLSFLWKRLQLLANRLLWTINGRLYQPLLRTALHHRYAALTIMTTIALCGMAMVSKGWIRTVFFPDVPSQIIIVELQTQNGAPTDLTASHIKTIEAAAQELNKEAMLESKSKAPPIARLMTALTGPNSAEIYAELQPEATRRIKTMEIIRRWRRRVGTLEGIETLDFGGSLETSGDFIVMLGARDDTILREAVNRFKAALGRIEGVHDIRDDFQRGSPKIRLRLKPEARHLGLTPADLAGQIGDAFGGLEIQRVQRGAEEVKVVVRYQEDQRRCLRDLLRARLRTSRDQWVPLVAVATVETGYMPAALYRQNGRRLVQVSATLDKSVISASEAFEWIQENLTPQLKALFPQLTITSAGGLEEMNEMKGSMKRILILILMTIYVLLAIPLKSYWQPLVIMSVIPFSFVGAAIGHWAMGAPISVLSFFGMMAVAGVVVNDSLVLLTRFNDIRSDDLDHIADSLLNAGRSCFRVILLTTLTTVCGLAPLLSETSEQAQYLIPAAISLAWGELFATPITLIIVPVLIYIADDGMRILKSLKTYLFPIRRSAVTVNGKASDRNW